MISWPTHIHNETELNELLSRPYPQLVEQVGRLEGDVVILGVGGKMGPSLAATLRRAVEEAGVEKRIYGVARFSDPAAKAYLEGIGVETIACDLLDRDAVERLPKVPNVVFMAGRKFGTQGNLELTWAMNVLVPGYVGRHYSESRIVVFSTGCVYPLVESHTGGCTEESVVAPIGEYSQSCLGRERAFEYFSEVEGTRVCHFRLNYAVDMRYGVLYDIASKVWAGEAVDVGMATFNVIWQGDAVNQALLALDICHSPAAILNCTGPETLRTCEIAATFGELMDRPVRLTGEEGAVAYLNDASRAVELFGAPRVSIDTLVRWTAHWVSSGGRSLDKPTHFEVQDGKY